MEKNMVIVEWENPHDLQQGTREIARYGLVEPERYREGETVIIDGGVYTVVKVVRSLVRLGRNLQLQSLTVEVMLSENIHGSGIEDLGRDDGIEDL